METWVGILILVIVIGIPMTSLLTALFIVLFNTIDIKSKFAGIKSKFNEWIEKKRDDYRAWKRHREVVKMHLNKLKPKKIKLNDTLSSGRKIEDIEIEDTTYDYIEDRMN